MADFLSRMKFKLVLAYGQEVVWDRTLGGHSRHYDLRERHANGAPIGATITTKELAASYQG